MTNISLEPGDWSLAELLASTEDGLLLDTPKSWSLDDKRLNFHFGTEVAYEINRLKAERNAVILGHNYMEPALFFSVMNMEFDLTVLAALLAVIGYSLNDTIVVFDRIRENFRKMRKGTAKEIVNISLNHTLGRTLGRLTWKGHAGHFMLPVMEDAGNPQRMAKALADVHNLQDFFKTVRSISHERHQALAKTYVIYYPRRL